MELELEMEMESKSQSKSDDCHGDEQLLLLLLTAASWAVVSAIKWSFKCNNNKANNDFTMYRNNNKNLVDNDNDDNRSDCQTLAALAQLTSKNQNRT